MGNYPPNNYPPVNGLDLLRLLRGSWVFWGRFPALGARVWDLTTKGPGNLE